ncbi:MAG: hypothetical protein L0Z62_50430 [Gemmataceae bacterium]|nr:hypothetical protein [Gemmataceae bacterium]
MINLLGGKKKKETKRSGGRPWKVIQAGPVEVAVWRNVHDDGALSFCFTLARVGRRIGKRFFPDDVLQFPALIGGLALALAEEASLPWHLRRQLGELAHVLVLEVTSEVNDELRPLYSIRAKPNGPEGGGGSATRGPAPGKPPESRK